MKDHKQVHKALFLLLLISLIVRAFLAALLEFGNDEVYYWTYALYPDLSHFDHPPMVGFLIQLTSLDLLFESEFFIRLGSVLLGTFNTWLIFLLGRKMKDALTGFYAALLYTGSIYAFIIAGVFILPDTPQLSFWLLTIYYLSGSITRPVNKKTRQGVLLAGIFAGLALASKYTSVFLLSGAALYLLFNNRNWFKTGALYLSALMAFLIFLPVVYWNFSNDFISFTYHSGRVGIFESGIRGDFFFTELGGQFFYNNPVNFVLGVIAIIAFFKKKLKNALKESALILWISLPLILMFLFFSLFRHTLPHWTGPAWTGIILLSAVFIREIGLKRAKVKLFPGSAIASVMLILVVIVMGIMQIRGGVFFYDNSDNPEELGRKDVSLDMFGWRQVAGEFKDIIEKEKSLKNIDPYSPLISHRWFPAANIDYYLARPNGIKVLGLGSLDGLHKYVRITDERGGYELGMDAWYITFSRDFHHPDMYRNYFNEIQEADTIPVYRGNKHVMNAFVYYLKGMKRIPE